MHSPSTVEVTALAVSDQPCHINTAIISRQLFVIYYNTSEKYVYMALLTMPDIVKHL